VITRHALTYSQAVSIVAALVALSLLMPSSSFGLNPVSHGANRLSIFIGSLDTQTLGPCYFQERPLKLSFGKVCNDNLFVTEIGLGEHFSKILPYPKNGEE
jgi:hypothetical protein